MKTKDLMIGDWVNVLPISRKVKAHYDKVESIRKEYTGQLYIEGGYHNREHIGDDWFDWSVGIDNIAPIPLTTEILKKNGFVLVQKENEEDNVYEEWKYENGLISICFEPTVIWLEVHNGGENSPVKTVNYYTDGDEIYVHELQHILKLLNIDKEIEL